MPDARLGSVEVYNILTSTSTSAALSANMGRVLNERLTALEEAGTGTGTIETASDDDIDALFI